MGNKNNFTFVDLIIAIIIFSTVVMFAIRSEIKNRSSFGRKIESPLVDRAYLVTAVDAETNVVIAMPYKFYKNDSAKTDRRLLLRVSNPYVCSNGVWFTKTKSGQEVIISSPIEENTPERTVYY